MAKVKTKKAAAKSAKKKTVKPVKTAKVAVKAAAKPAKSKDRPKSSAKIITSSSKSSSKSAVKGVVSSDKNRSEKKKAEPVKFEPPKPPKKLSAEMLALRERLINMLTDMRKEIDHEVRGATERDLAHLNDTSDMATDAAEGDLALRIAESETVEASEIERAIEKLDNGTYGQCEICNVAIPTERLQVLPFATQCVKCQELADIRRRSRVEELDDLNTDGGDMEE
jgi:DnaK suppressor protein